MTLTPIRKPRRTRRKSSAPDAAKVRKFIAQQVTAVRTSKGLTKSAVARSIGVSRRSWIRFEQCTAVIPSEVLILFAKHVGEPMSTFHQQYDLVQQPEQRAA